MLGWSIYTVLLVYMSKLSRVVRRMPQAVAATGAPSTRERYLYKSIFSKNTYCQHVSLKPSVLKQLRVLIFVRQKIIYKNP